MSLSTECLGVSQVESLLQGNLTPEEHEAAQDHLEHCETCRARVEATIGPAQWWSDVQSVLRSNASLHVAASLRDAAEDDARLGETRLRESVLDLLGPTDDPNMLGRIGPYEIVALLGQGGMGAVFKGFDRSLNRFVAIKMLLPHLAASGAARKRFAREAQAVAAVVDDHVMAIHCVDEWQGVPYLVMTYSRGVSLQKRLNDNGPLEVREILRIGMQAAKGLAAAHAQGIVHRDIKPANIFLDQTVERVQLMDFGLARAVDDASLTRTGVLAGTPQYMSPEQARAESVDQRSDLFSLGSVMYAMCTGHAPFRAESSYGVLRLITDQEPRSIQEINPDVPDWLCAIVAKLMAKQACDRFETAGEVSRLLEECLAHVQQPSITPLPKALLPQASKRFIFPTNRKGLWIMLGSTGMFLMGMLIWRATEPPDISGKWTSDEWGTVELKENEPGRYEGKLENGLFVFGKAPFNHKQWASMACVNCHKGTNDFAGKIDLKWSRVENRFNGTWRIPENHSGKLSIRLVENEIRGGWTTSKKSDTHLGTPRLGDLTWKRVSGEPDASTQSNDTNSSKQNQPLDFNGSHSSLYLPKEFGKSPLKLDLAWDSAGGELAFAVELFNREIQKRFPNHGQPPLTKDELVSCASWNKLHKENSSTVGRLLSAIATRHQLLEGWAIHGDFVELPPKDTPVRAYQIVLKHNVSGEQFLVRQRFVAPLKSLSNTNSQEAESKGIPLSAAIKRFNETNFRVDSKKQPPLTEEEVIAAILHQHTRRDEYDVSDSLFKRLQSIADTRVLPEDASLEVIPKFGTEGETMHTIWSVRVKLVQDEAGREGWTYAFILREQFLSVTHGDAGKIHWGTPGANGLQTGFRLSPPVTHFQMGQRIDVELFYRNVLTKSIEATIATFPSYAIELYDENGERRRVLESGERILAGAQVEWIGEQPLSRKVSPIVLAPSNLGPDEEASMRADCNGANLVFVKPGMTYRLKFTVNNVASNDSATLLSTSKFKFTVSETDEVSASSKNVRKRFFERAELAYATILKYLNAVKQQDLETSRAIDRNDERVRDKLSAISGSATPNQPESAWVANQSALIAFGPVESHDRELNGKLILYILAFVDERWFLVDVSIETAASLSIKGELFLKEHPEAIRTITRVNDTVKQE
jgi:serine/threonine protein kinase